MVKRIARMGDGWFSFFQPDDAGRHMMEKFWGYVEAAGRQRGDIGIEAWITVNNAKVLAGRNQKPEDKLERSPEQWREEMNAWKDLGATHLGCWTMYADYTPDQHIDAARRFKEAAASI